MLASFSLAQFRFELEPEDRLALHPRNPGNTLRGAFGATFKRLVCPTPSDCHKTCRHKATCPYGLVFDPSPPPETDCLRLNQDIPRPFILRPPDAAHTRADAGSPLTFDLILIGQAIEAFPYFLVTFRELGHQGLGLGRGRFEIKRVVQASEPLSVNRSPFSVNRDLQSAPADYGQRETENGDQTDNGQRQTENGAFEIYSSEDQFVRPSLHRLTFDDCRRLASERFTGNGLRSTDRGSRAADNGKRTTDHGLRITVQFLTPTHLKADGKIVTRPEFHHLIKRLRDRINALAHFYCDDTLDVDFKAFGERAEAVRTVSCHVRWEDRDRRSWKTGLSHDMGGFIGEVTYEGDLQEFLPLLILGQYTHVGKYAVWGNGQYEVTVI